MTSVKPLVINSFFLAILTRPRLQTIRGVLRESAFYRAIEADTGLPWQAIDYEKVHIRLPHHLCHGKAKRLCLDFRGAFSHPDQEPQGRNSAVPGVRE
jgi:hypothetical protein